MKPSKSLMTFLMSLVQKRDAQGNKKMSPLRTLFTIFVLGAASYWGFSDAEAMEFGGWDNGVLTFIDGHHEYRCPLAEGDTKDFGTTWVCETDAGPKVCFVEGPPNHLTDCKDVE